MVQLIEPLRYVRIIDQYTRSLLRVANWRGEKVTTFLQLCVSRFLCVYVVNNPQSAVRI